jgi:hypothetical protein
MLAGRLVRAASDILNEYSEFKLVELLNEASTLAEQRGQLLVGVYIEKARSIRQRAESIMHQTKIERYPNDLREFLKGSKYSTALPEFVARILLQGFPDDMNQSIHSSEVKIYVKLVNTLRSELGALTTAAQKLSIDEITVPAEEISLDVIIPRSAFGNRSDKFIEILGRFDSVMSYLIELTTGSAGSPTLTYTSTSDPVTGLAMAGAAVWSFLQFYKLALEVAEKQISLFKMVKEFRSSPLSTSADLENQIKTIVEGYLSKAVEGAIAAAPQKVSEDRINEIKVGISKDARFVVQAISNGARVGITIESLDSLSLISAAVPEATLEKINEELASQRTLETQVARSLSSLGEPAPALLTVETLETNFDQPER